MAKRSARNGATTESPALDQAKALAVAAVRIQTDVDTITNAHTKPVDRPRRMCRLEIDEVFPSEFNPRTEFDPEYIEQLGKSIVEHGQLQAIGVRRRDVGRYEIIFGECRWRAMKGQSLHHIDAVIFEGIDDREHMDMAIVENVKRKDINPIEEARGYQRLLALGNKTKGVAEKVGKSSPAISNTLRLLRLPEDIQQMIADGRLSRAHGVALGTYEPWPDALRLIAERAIADGESAHAIESGIPYQVIHQLQDKGLVQTVGYHAPFDRKICNDCPHGAARRYRGSDAIVCFKPDHFVELETEGKTKAEARAKKAQARALKKIDAAAAEGDDSKLPKISELEKTINVHRIQEYKHPPECTGECACRRRVIDDRWGTKKNVVDVCVDTKRFESLVKRASRESNKKGRSNLTHQKQLVEETLEKISDVDVRLAAILMAKAISQIPTSVLENAITRLAINGLDHKTHRYGDSRSTWLNKLAALEVPQLLRLGVECLIQEEIAYRVKHNPSEESPTASWLLKALKKDAAGATSAETPAIAGEVKS